MFAVDRVAVLVCRGESRGASHATNTAATDMKDLQNTIGEGPGADAWETRDPVLTSNLDSPRPVAGLHLTGLRRRCPPGACPRLECARLSLSAVAGQVPDFTPYTRYTSTTPSSSSHTKANMLTAPLLRQALLRTQSDTADRNVVVDLCSVEFIDGSGAQPLIEAREVNVT
ncbi:STAS domain-containing protein [Streptomyces galilaeus]